MDEQKQKLIERIRQAQNILVTVSANPSVDQLSAAIGLTIALNKLDKHGTAVFSGQVPSTIEFLKPEDTLEKNTDSLRDFIIALDKSKADKLRYKVEDQVVRIFITPFRTSLSQNDLNFSQGDFNVDVVIALGVTEQQDLDTAISAHGRILHDATVASVTTTGQGSLGTINWVDPTASSLSEMVSALIDGLDKKALDGQIATALLTGIVASTERFSNEKTSPKTMSASAALMAAGANQQLIATELATPAAPAPVPVMVSDITPPPSGEGAKRDPGTLEIEHESFTPDTPEPIPAAEAESQQPQIQVDDNGNLTLPGQEPAPAAPQISHVRGVGTDGASTEAGASEVKRELITGPPQLGDAEITASASPEGLEPSAEELTLPAVQSPMLSHKSSVLSPLPEPTPVDAPAPLAAAPVFDPPLPPAFQPPPPSWQPPTPPVAPASAPAPFTPPMPPVSASPFVPPAPATVDAPALPSSAPFIPPTPTPVDAPAAQPSASGTTLSQIEKSVGSPHVQISDDGILTNVPAPGAAPAADAPAAAQPAPPPADVNDARSAVEAAYNSSSAPTPTPQPLAALNATPLGPDLRPITPLGQIPEAAPADPAPTMPVVPNTGFSEPTPGNTPADSTLDMPLPSNPFGPGQQATPPASALVPPPSSFPGAPTPAAAGPPPPPVPPPIVPPLP